MIFRGTCSLLFTSLWGPLLGVLSLGSSPWGPLLAFTIDLYIQVCLCHLLLLPLSFSNMSLAFYLCSRSLFLSLSVVPDLFCLSLRLFLYIFTLSPSLSLSLSLSFSPRLYRGMPCKNDKV